MSGREAFITFCCMALFAGSAASQQTQKVSGPAMAVHFDYYLKDRARIRQLEHRLASAMERAGVGQLGATELHLDGNDGYLYMYGPDADRLYGVVAAILKSSKLMSDAEITVEHGRAAE